MVFIQIIPERRTLFFGHAVNDAEILFVQLSVLYLLVEYGERFCVFRRYDYAAGISVEPVAKGWCKGVLTGGIIFALLVEISAETVYECGLAFPAVACVDKLPLGLVYKDDILILVHYLLFFQVKPRRFKVGCLTLLFSVVEKLVGNIELYFIAFLYPRPGLGFFSAELYALCSEKLIEERIGNIAKRLLQELVHSLAVIVFCDNYRSYEKHSLLFLSLYDKSPVLSTVNKRAKSRQPFASVLKFYAGEPCGCQGKPCLSKGGALSAALCSQHPAFSGPFSDLFHSGIGRSREVCIPLPESRAPIS